MDPLWLTQLRQPLKDESHLRWALVGVGNDLWGDDGVGPAVVHSLKGCLPGSKRILLVDAGPAPENFTGELREFGPDIVLVIDAAEIGERPGSYQLIELGDLEGFSASAHTLPLSMVCTYLQNELNCKILLIGIQPESIEFGAGLSNSVYTAVSSLVGELKTLFEELQSLKV